MISSFFNTDIHKLAYSLISYVLMCSEGSESLVPFAFTARGHYRTAPVAVFLYISEELSKFSSC